LSAGTIVGEPLDNFAIARGTEKDRQVARLFERVGLRPDAMRKYAHESPAASASDWASPRRCRSIPT